MFWVTLPDDLMIVRWPSLLRSANLVWPLVCKVTIWHRPIRQCSDWQVDTVRAWFRRATAAAWADCVRSLQMPEHNVFRKLLPSLQSMFDGRHVKLHGADQAMHGVWHRIEHFYYLLLFLMYKTINNKTINKDIKKIHNLSTVCSLFTHGRGTKI